MGKKWANTEPPYFSKSGRFPAVPTPRGARLVTAQVSISSIIASIISYLIPFLLEWLFGLIKFPGDAPIFGPLRWLQERPIVIFLVGVVILLPLLFILQRKYPPIANVMRWLTQKRWVALVLVPIAVAVAFIAIPSLTARVLSLVQIVQQHLWVLIIPGVVILGSVLGWLEARYKLVSSTGQWLKEERWRLYVSTALALLVVVLTIAAVAHPSVSIQFPSPKPTPTPGFANYTSPAPGPACNPKQKKLWSNRTSASTETCTAQKMDLTVEPGLFLGEIGFDPRTLPGAGSLQTYCVQVTATFVTGGEGDAFIIGVHGQTPGGQVVEFFQSGDMTVLRFDSDRNPSPGPELYTGSFDIVDSYQLAVGVDGPNISVWVNQTKVGDTSDPTYTRTDYVIVGVKSDGTNAAEALFSNFVFKTLKPGDLAKCGE